MAAFSLHVLPTFTYSSSFSFSRCPLFSQLLLLHRHYYLPLLSPHQPFFLSHSIVPTVPRASSNFPPLFFGPLLKFFPASSLSLSLSVSQISASVAPTQRIAAVRSSCVRVRLYPSESVSGGIHFTHVLRRFKLSLIHIHRRNSAYFQKCGKSDAFLFNFIRVCYVPLGVMK